MTRIKKLGLPCGWPRRARPTTLALALAALPCAGPAQEVPDWNTGAPLVFDATATYTAPMAVDKPLNIVVAEGVRLRLEGAISTPVGGIGLVKDGPGRLELVGESPQLERNTLLREGTLHLEGTLPLGPYYRLLQAQAGATLSYGDQARIDNTLAVAAAAGAENTALYWRVDGGSATHAGDIQGSARLVKQGAGTLRLTGVASWPDATLAVHQGELALEGVFAGAVQVGAGGWLSGAGRAGWLDVAAGAHWAPMGTLSISHGLTAAPGSTLHVRAWPDGGADRVVVDQGAAQLGGAVWVLPQGEPADWPQVSEHLILQARDGLQGEFAQVESVLPWLTPRLNHQADAVWLALQPLGQEDEATPPQDDGPPPPDGGTAPETETPPDPGPETPPPDTAEPRERRPRGPRPKPDPRPTPPPPTRPAAPEVAPPQTPEPAPQPPEDTAPAQPEDEHPSAPPEPNRPEQPPEPAPEPAPDRPEPTTPPEPASPARPTPAQPTLPLRHHEGWMATLRTLLSEDSRFIRDTAWAAAAAPQGAWAQVYGAQGRRHTSATPASRSMGGVLLGGQMALGERWRVQGFAGAAHTRAWGKADGTPRARARVDSVNFGAQTVLDHPAGWRFSLGAAASRHRLLSTRPIHAPGLDETARARGHAWTLQGFARGDWPVTEWLTPWADVAWVQTRLPRIRETGSRLAIQTQASTQQHWTGRLGLRAEHALGNDGQDGLLHAALAWRSTAGDRQAPLTLRFTGDALRHSARVTGITIARHAWEVDVGAQLRLGKQGQLNLGYQGQYDAHWRDHALGLRVRWRF